AAAARAIYERWSVLSYNRGWRSGPRSCMAARPLSFFVRSAEAGRRDQVTAVPDSSPADLLDFVTLSLLLPSRRWLAAAERLRAGDRPGAVLDTMLDDDDGSERRDIRRRASSAVEQANRSALAPICWDSASYPLALRTIVDPPPVLWVSGSIEVLN